ncbi:MAG: SMC-Scp complex subunit ScpB [Candidatus Omnitrophota bacterium]|jgi:segregation and condensation protein B
MPDNITAVVEALLFAAEQPLSLEQLCSLVPGSDTAMLREAVTRLKQEYETGGRGVRVDEVAGGYRMTTAPELSGFVRRLYRQRRSDKLSRPAMETLAIIAYKQPVTRQEVQSLRSVNIDGVMKNLLEKNLIRISGKKDAPGRPFVFGTTRQFLEYFGLNSIEEMPKLDSIEVGAAALAVMQQSAEEKDKKEDGNESEQPAVAD